MNNLLNKFYNQLSNDINKDFSNSLKELIDSNNLKKDEFIKIIEEVERNE